MTGWLIAAGVWLVLALAVALIIGRTIALADRRQARADCMARHPAGRQR